MWIDRINIIFRNYTCNPGSFIEHAIKNYQSLMLYNKDKLQILISAIGIEAKPIADGLLLPLIGITGIQMPRE